MNVILVAVSSNDEPIDRILVQPVRVVYSDIHTLLFEPFWITPEDFQRLGLHIVGVVNQPVTDRHEIGGAVLDAAPSDESAPTGGWVESDGTHHDLPSAPSDES